MIFFATKYVEHEDYNDQFDESDPVKLSEGQEKKLKDMAEKVLLRIDRNVKDIPYNEFLNEIPKLFRDFLLELTIPTQKIFDLVIKYFRTSS